MINEENDLKELPLFFMIRQFTSILVKLASMNTLVTNIVFPGTNIMFPRTNIVFPSTSDVIIYYLYSIL